MGGKQLVKERKRWDKGGRLNLQQSIQKYCVCVCVCVYVCVVLVCICVRLCVFAHVCLCYRFTSLLPLGKPNRNLYPQMTTWLFSTSEVSSEQ